MEASIWEYFEIGKYAGVQFWEILSHKLVAWGCSVHPIRGRNDKHTESYFTWPQNSLISSPVLKFYDWL